MSVTADPANRDALFQEARALREQQRVPEALAVLARLEALHPRFSRLFQERGHCHVLLGEASEALAALRESVRLNPALPASWDMMAQLYGLTGEAELAAQAGDNLSTLQQLPPEVVVANSLYADQDLDAAEDVIRDYLSRDSGNIGAMRLLARICRDRDALAEAEALLAVVLERAPDYHAARLDYAMVLLQQQKHLAARRQAEHLLEQDPGHREYLKQYAAACVGLGDYEPVIELYSRLLADQRASGTEEADLHLWRANALKTAGWREAAIEDYRAALTARPDYGVAWFSLANLKTYRFTEDDIARMRAAELRADLADMDRVYLCFALGKALEDQENYAASWRYYERGNAVRRLSSRWRPEVAEACVSRLRAEFTADFFAARAGWGVADPAPIFIVGLPRSGSTLVEQILASHAHVEGTQELTLIDRLAGEVFGLDPDCGLPLRPEALAHLNAADVRELGEQFLEEARVYRRLGRPFFIDKMPNNFWHVGLIHLLLPKAIILDVRRNPMACCFGNLKQLFGTTNQEFAYDAADVARHYRCYVELMRHWDEVMPGRVLRVRHEDVVEDLEGAVGRLLAHCRLPYDPACLTFHETKRSIRTPSSEQVRQPISREGLVQWRNYEPWLGPLRDAIGEDLIADWG